MHVSTYMERSMCIANTVCDQHSLYDISKGLVQAAKKTSKLIAIGLFLLLICPGKPHNCSKRT